MADVFLSYARADEALAARVRERLQQARYSVWWDQNITPLGPYAETIQRQLKSATAVVVLWTDASLNSEWVTHEASKAYESRKLVSLLFGVDVNSLPLELHRIEAADLSNWQGEDTHPKWVRAVDWIAKLIRARRIRLLLAAIVLIAALAGGITLATSGRFSSLSASLEISILSPPQSASTEPIGIVSGFVSRPSTRVSVVIHPIGTAQFWVQEEPSVRPDGTWEITARYGGQRGSAYEVRAFANPVVTLKEGDTLATWPQAEASSETRLVRMNE